MKDFFHYTKSERIGILVLLTLCLAVWVLPMFFQKEAGLSESENADLQELAAAWQIEETETNTYNNSATSTGNEKIARRPFNPNTADRAILEAFDLPASTIRSWLSYTSKGGYWKNAQALNTFRALKAEDFQRLQTYLIFDSTENTAADFDRNDEEEMPLQPVVFDPNTVTAAQLQEMGLSEKLAKTWINFTSKGGQFRAVEDIRKIYGLKPEQADQLIPFAQIANEAVADETTNSGERPTAYNTTSVSVDINQSTAENWAEIRGIGPVLSTRIISFRNKLGGFSSINQVGETYGLPDSTFQQIRRQLKLSPILQQLAINELDAAALAAHPYLSWKEANAIINYRTNHGAFTNLSDLAKVLALRPETVERMGPYLFFE